MKRSVFGVFVGMVLTVATSLVADELGKLEAELAAKMTASQEAAKKHEAAKVERVAASAAVKTAEAAKATADTVLVDAQAEEKKAADVIPPLERAANDAERKRVGAYGKVQAMAVRAAGSAATTDDRKNAQEALDEYVSVVKAKEAADQVLADAKTVAKAAADKVPPLQTAATTAATNKATADAALVAAKAKVTAAADAAAKAKAAADEAAAKVAAEKRIVNLETEVTSLKKQLSATDGRVTKVEDRLSKFEQQQAEVRKQLDGLEKLKVSSEEQAKKIAEILTSLETTKSTLASQAKELRKIKETDATAVNKLNKLEERLAKLDELRARIVTKDDLGGKFGLQKKERRVGNCTYIEWVHVPLI